MKDNFQNMTVGQLVQEFLTVTVAQYRADLVEDIPKYNRLYRRMKLLEQELKGRAGDQRRALLPLCDHSNAHVRLRAAVATLALAPEKARETLQIIHDRREYPDAANAFGLLIGLDDGPYVPD
jgi:hypothetical protein